MEAIMIDIELNTELASSFASNKQSVVTITNDTILPRLGLKARELLDKSQLGRLVKIRDKKLKSPKQKESFIGD